MWSDYFFYLIGLLENERNVQITILVAFWLVMLGVGILVEYIKKSYGSLTLFLYKNLCKR